MVMRRCRPDEGLDECDEGLDVPGGMKNIESLEVLPQSAEGERMSSSVMLCSEQCHIRHSVSLLALAS